MRTRRTTLAIRRSCTTAARQLRAVGDVGSLVRTFSAADVADFARITGDNNPLHDDEKFASTHRFGARVVHGMLYASMFSAIIGQRTPGAVYLSQTLAFRKPVLLDDTITAEVEVLKVGRAGRLLDFSTRCTNQRDELVLSGDARVMLPASSRE